MRIYIPLRSYKNLLTYTLHFIILTWAKHETFCARPPTLNNEVMADNIYTEQRHGSEVGATDLQKGHDIKS
jgi:hypothetical protein